MSIMLLH